MNTDHRILIKSELPTIGANFDSTAFSKTFNNSTLIVNAHASNVSYPTHWGALSIKCAFNGVEHYHLNGFSYSVSRSAFLILNNGTRRSSHIDKQAESFTISIAPDLEREVFAALTRTHLRNLDDPFSHPAQPFRFREQLYPFHGNPLTQLLAGLRNELNDLDQPELLNRILTLLETGYNHQQLLSNEIRSMYYSREKTKVELYRRLTMARDYIIGNYKENLTLAQIAGVACLNTFYFLREFRKLFKTTPHKFLQQIRLNEARYLLHTTGMPVCDVCHEVGFEDVASFSKLYKRKYKFHPSERTTLKDQ